MGFEVSEPAAYWIGGRESLTSNSRAHFNCEADGTYSVVIKDSRSNNECAMWRRVCRFCCLLLSLGIVREVWLPAAGSGQETVYIAGIRSQVEATAIHEAVLSCSPSVLDCLIGNLEACEQVKMLTIAA
ncbi:hypothetical protein DF196_01665 [Bifidobacterium callitrichidarum]|uniref:Uncharacterized protein n=1 Tax=Bifidobacterium callitrichidarum TaxID=2052941 RepID=A0A2U2NC75_9BIFI|nr:hypothetical protein DF196_01665 [Bifidobacterium callitrichidarum]